MKITIISLFVLLSLPLLAGKNVFLSPDHRNQGWELIREVKGLVIYSKPTENSEIRSLLAKGVINAPIDKICTILRDVESGPTWAPNLISKKTLQAISDTEAVTYDIRSLPWPASDRDLVVHNKLHLDRNELFLKLVSQSLANHYGDPGSKDRVRAFLNKAVIALRPLDQDKTYTEMVLQVDPRGKIPAWVVNYWQRNWPVNFVKGIEKRAKAIKARPNPGISNLLHSLNLLLKKKIVKGK